MVIIIISECFNRTYTLLKNIAIGVCRAKYTTIKK